MAGEIKELIEKIQKEGIQQAQDKAAEIEAQAKAEAAQILARAKQEAQNLLTQAKENINKMEASSRAALKQAARDTLISLRKEINDLLNKIIILAVRQALGPSELGKILHTLITETAKQNRNNIIIALNKPDLDDLKQGFLANLKEELKKGLTLKASEDISAGFLISFDAGGSYFDFTDQALAEYLSQYLKPELAKLLKK